MMTIFESIIIMNREKFTYPSKSMSEETKYLIVLFFVDVTLPEAQELINSRSTSRRSSVFLFLVMSNLISQDI